MFDREAAWYDAAHDGLGVEGHALRARLDTVLKLLGGSPGSVLDTGMGPGRLAEQLALRGWTVSGVDASERMVALARRRVPDAADRFLHAPVERLPFANDVFDAVVATGVLEFVTDPRVAAAEAGRVLRPGGAFVASIPNRTALHVLSKRAFYPAVRLAKRTGAGRRPAPARRRFMSPGETASLLAAEGLWVEAVEYTSYAAVPTPFDLVLRSASGRLAAWLERRGPTLERVLATQIVFLARKRGRDS